MDNLYFKSLLFIFSSTLITPLLGNVHYHPDVVIHFHFQPDLEYLNDFGNRHDLIYHSKILDHYHKFVNKKVRRRSTVPHDYETKFIGEPDVKWFEQQIIKSRQKRDFIPKDPMYKDMWYLYPEYEEKGSSRTSSITRHMNVSFAWELGFSGKGIKVSILDDGIEYTHPDLKENYDKDSSWDVNGNDDDPIPAYNYRNDKILPRGTEPKKDMFQNGSINPPLTDSLKGYSKEINRHGTRCAGEVAATADNNVCVPGIAYKAQIGGVRMLDGDVTDAVEAASIGHNQQHVDIYSASWGPDDDGRTVDGPAKLAIEAFYKGATEGRAGKGNIFVWASGNGGRYEDNCNCDGYTNSIYTVSISSTSQNENIPWYSEQCASTIASTYSSGTSDEKQIMSTDLRGLCTAKHTGTSASAPIAAAILALALEARPDLTWRDVQHLIIRTSKKNDLHTTDWNQNSVGRWFSGRYGYGLMDAGHLVIMAKDWKLVPEQRVEKKSIVVNGITMNKADKKDVKGSTTTYTFNVDGEIDKIEHVTTIVTMSQVPSRRGKLRFYIQSPSGTKSMILGTRSKDTSTKGFDSYEFLSMELWDEKAKGDWSFIAENTDGNLNPAINGLDVVIRGTGNDQYHEIEDTPPTTKTTSTKTTTTTTTKTTTSTTIKTTTTKSMQTEKQATEKFATTSTKAETKPTSTNETKKTTESIKPKITDEPIDEVIFDPQSRDHHSGFKHLLGYLVIGCLLMFLISNWYVNKNSNPGSSSRDKIQYSPLREKD